MLETSKDLLYLILAFCALLLTVFGCWLIYYLAMITRQAYQLTKSFKDKLDKAEALLDFFRNKVEHSASHLALVAEAVGQLVKYLIDKKSEKPKDKKK